MPDHRTRPPEPRGADEPRAYFGSRYGGSFEPGLGADEARAYSGLRYGGSFEPGPGAEEPRA
ncbi:hypothetical protein [Nocardia sp. CC201C]|uniref:hypothetical protein n=1 Tax=Nocardia sp. CC201C TaxID=3044575 RepID=UPI0024A91BDB|nr:hypothetical protein [Nocardia sp. CC201C]